MAALAGSSIQQLPGRRTLSISTIYIPPRLIMSDRQRMVAPRGRHGSVQFVRGLPPGLPGGGDGGETARERSAPFPRRAGAAPILRHAARRCRSSYARRARPLPEPSSARQAGTSRAAPRGCAGSSQVRYARRAAACGAALQQPRCVFTR